MLYITDDGIVMLKEDASAFDEVKALKVSDKSNGRVNFQKWITYVYHTYCPKHTYSFLSFQARKEKVFRRYFFDEDPGLFEETGPLKDFIELYKTTVYSATELFQESMKHDMETLLTHLREIPLFIKKKVEVDVDVEVMERGKLKKKVIRTVASIDVDNSDERFKAIEKGDKLMVLYDKMQERIRREDLKKKKNDRSLFDLRSNERTE